MIHTYESQKQVTNQPFRLKKDEMHPDDPMYAYVMKHKRVETKKVISLFESHKKICKKFGQKVQWKVDVMKLNVHFLFFFENNPFLSFFASDSF